MPAAIDIETATSAAGSICSIGVALIGPGGAVTSRKWMVRPPGNRYSGFNSRVHGLDAASTREAPGIEDVWLSVQRFLSGADFVVAHSAGFERRHLVAALDGIDRSLPRWSLACTLAASRSLHPRKSGHGLAAMARHYALELEHHNPESDAIACVRLVAKLGITRSLSKYAVSW